MTLLQNGGREYRVDTVGRTQVFTVVADDDGFQKIGPAMPTVLRINGYQFYCYAEEGNEPPPIHVAKGGFDAKFWLSPAQLAVNHGFRPRDLREIVGIIEQHAQLILEKWNEFFRP